jgi:putative nucleotidyltransferase with HDIG domain
MEPRDQTPQGWQPRPGFAALLRAFVLIAPIAASVAFVHVASQLIGPPSGSWLTHVTWWVGLSAAATLVLIGIDRLTRRLLPLAALLKLALVFPDEAPSRFRTALRAGTTAELEGRIAHAREGAEKETPVEAAERLLGYVAALSAHDKVTRGHSERVRAYAQMIGRELRLGREEVDRLNWAALLHDIGKLEIPREILNKPVPPTDEEWVLIRRHPEVGGRLAEPLRAWLGEWTNAISDHHERWDGAGYPKGIEGESISLAGRIVAVADVFDVMTSARSYKPPGDPATARDEIARCAGGQFDPRVVRAFLSISLGRLRLAMGPLSWLAQAPVLGRIPLTPGVATVASSALAVVGSVAAGLLGTPHIPSTFASTAQAAPAGKVALLTPGGRQIAAISPGLRGGAAHASPPAPLPAPLAKAAAVLQSFAPDPAPPAPPVPPAPPSSDPPPADPPPAAPPSRPAFTAGADQVVAEDSGPRRVEGWASAIRGEGIAFALSGDHAALFDARGEPSLRPDGTLTYTPAADASGTAHITVTAVAGDGRRSASVSFVITVTPVNDPPAFVGGADQTLREDAGPQSVADWARAISPGPADEAGQSVSLSATTTNPSLFAAGGQPAVAADGTLTYTPAADATGLATVTVAATDDGGTAAGGVDSSAPQTFLIAVTPVNDAPSFAAGADQALLEDSGPRTVPGWARAIRAGPADEANQVVTFAVSSNAPALFTAGGQPAVGVDGTLTYTPAANASGSATVTVRAVDDGGTASGGVERSAPQTFLIAVTPVNDTPSFTAGADQALLEDAGTQAVAGWATAITAGPGDESGQVVSFTVSSDNPALFTAGGQPAVAADGTLTYTPAADASGVATVTARAVDDGGTSGGGSDTSAPQTFVITVTAVNDVPAFTAGAVQTAFENAAAQTVAGWATAITAGPADESAQVVSFSVSSDNPALFTAGGQPAVAASGTLTFTPAAGAHGVANVSVRAVDSGGTAGGGVDTSAPQAFTITIVNRPPVANADAPTVLENDSAGVTFNVLANDTDPEGDPLAVASFDDSTIANGGLTDNGNGSFTYVPAPHFSGTDAFSYTVGDGAGNTATAVVTITVTAVPDPPAAADDAFATPQDTALVQPPPGLLANDADSAAGTLTVDTVPVVAPASGALSLGTDGSFTYTPSFGFTGTDTFTYRVTSSATGLSSNAVATITVSATSSTSLLYLRNTGPTSELWNMTTTAPPFSLLVPDYDSDLAPGLTIKSGDGHNFGDAKKSQTWRFPFAAGVVLNGPVTLHLWSSGGGFGGIYAYLYDCTSGGSCTQIASGHLQTHNWLGLGLGFSEHDVTVGTVSRTVTAGHELRIGLYATGGDQWVAMTSSFPSSLELSIP